MVSPYWFCCFLTGSRHLTSADCADRRTDRRKKEPLEKLMSMDVINFLRILQFLYHFHSSNNYEDGNRESHCRVIAQIE